jgi:hypothetical protein
MTAITQSADEGDERDEYPGLEPIIARCRADGGVTKTTLGELRTALGYGRLGRWVLGAISEALDESGLGHFPTNLLQPQINDEPRQTQELWLFIQDESPIARVINAVLAPEDDAEVRSVLVAIRLDDEAELTPEQKLERVRAIVG